MSHKKHYSGEASTKFWDAVNRLKGDQWDWMYLIGVSLQNLENEALRQLDAATRAQKKATKTAKRK